MRNVLICHTCITVYCLLLLTAAQSQVQKIYVHPKVVGNAKQSQFVDSIRFIPLEVRDGIETGAYSNIDVTEKYFIVTDYPSKTLLLYSKDGRFVRKISFKKLGQNFYPAYNENTNRVVFLGTNKNYTLTSKDALQIKLDWNNPRNKKYYKKYVIDLNDTSFVIKKDVPDENDILRAYHYYDDFYWSGAINTSPLYDDTLDYELKIYKDHRLVKGFFPYNHINEPRFLFANENASFIGTDTPYIRFVTRPFCDTVYKMIRDSLFPVYQLVFPLENSLPSSFFTTPFKNKGERENFTRNNGWMLRQVYNFYETPRFFFFMVGYLANFDSYVYVKNTNTIFKAKSIKPDSSQYNLNLLGNFSLRKQDRFYKSQKAGDLLTFFEQNKNVPVPKELESFLKAKPSAGSPVIVEFKIKNQL